MSDSRSRMKKWYCVFMISKKGITPIVSSLLLIIVVVVLISLAFIFFTKMFNDVSGSTSGQAKDASNKIAEDFKIDSISLNRIYIRNSRTTAIPSAAFKFYVNDAWVAVLDYDKDPGLLPDEVGCYLIDNSGGLLAGPVIIRVSGTVKSDEKEVDYTGVNPATFFTTCPDVG